MNKKIRTFQGTVYPWHCDQMGHMNVQYYAEKFNQASWQFLSHLGLTTTYLNENKRGMVALEQHVKYKRELLALNEISIESQLIEAKGKIIRFTHFMMNNENNQIASEAEFVALYINMETRKGIELPHFVIEGSKEFAKSAVQFDLRSVL